MLASSLNEDILDQMHADQSKSVLADKVLLKWNKAKDKLTALTAENKEMKSQLAVLLSENNETRQKFTFLLDSFQQNILY